MTNGVEHTSIPSEQVLRGTYEVIVVGAGHAGCEAALASARMGRKTLLLTMNLDSVALMPCNPSMGGPAKGHLIKEIDALGGEIGRNTDRTFIQIRLLNTSKGPAVQALRAQCDKQAYRLAMKFVLESQPNLELKQATITQLLSQQNKDGRTVMTGVVTNNGWRYEAKAVILTTGTFINGRLVVGEKTQPGGRAGEGPALGISDSLRALGLEVRRFKTGTPRVLMHARLILARPRYSRGVACRYTSHKMSRPVQMCSFLVVVPILSIPQATKTCTAGGHNCPAIWYAQQTARTRSFAATCTVRRYTQALSRVSDRATVPLSKIRLCVSPIRVRTRFFLSRRDGAQAKCMYRA